MTMASTIHTRGWKAEMSQQEREEDFRSWWKKNEGTHRLVKEFYVPTTKDSALTTVMVITFRTHKDRKFCLDVMKKDEVALKVKEVRIFARPQFGKTTEFVVKHLIGVIKLVARESPKLDKELELDKPNRMIKLKGPKVHFA